MPKAQHLPTIEYYWTNALTTDLKVAPVVNVRIKATNGLIVGQITQGFKDKRDARRGVDALLAALIPERMAPFAEGSILAYLLGDPAEIKEKGPGPKPKAKGLE